MDQNSYRYAEPIKSVELDPQPAPEHWSEKLSGRILLIGFLIAMFATVGGFDHADQLASEAKAKRERAARIMAYHDMHTQVRLGHPCKATIQDGMTSVTMSEPRCVRVKEEKR